MRGWAPPVRATLKKRLGTWGLRALRWRMWGTETELGKPRAGTSDEEERTPSSWHHRLSQAVALQSLRETVTQLGWKFQGSFLPSLKRPSLQIRVFA